MKKKINYITKTTKHKQAKQMARQAKIYIYIFVVNPPTIVNNHNSL